MEPDAYARMAQHESHHWWFVARRRVIQTIIQQKIGRKIPHLAEIGAGTGGNMVMLRQFGAVTGIEPSAQARAFAAKRGIHLLDGGLPAGDQSVGFGTDSAAQSGAEAFVDSVGLPLADGSQSLVLLLDVLEHIEDDQAALEAIFPKIMAGGKLLLTVPAVPWLWSVHDEVHHHKRRYTKKELINSLNKAGYGVEYITYFNTVLFPVVLILRAIKRCLNSKQADDAMPHSWLNTVLQTLFNIEAMYFSKSSILPPLPYGLSLLAIAVPASPSAPVSSPDREADNLVDNVAG